MNITKYLSEQIAKKMVAPIEEKIKSLSEEKASIAYDAIQRTIPQDLKDCFDKYKSNFIKSGCATLLNGTQEIRVCDLDYFPAYNSYYPRVEIESDIMHKICKLQLKIEKLREEKEKTYESIVSTLLSLKTFKKAKENFPAAYEHMKAYEEEGKTALCLPVDEILSTLEKYK